MRLAALYGLLALFASAADKPGEEPFRPQYHYTPARNWMNDPNGLVYFDGEYHLFYQYNPKGDKWGHMSWGHAVSKNLLTWKHLPVALAEDKGAMIFSGSAVVDHANTTGFGKDGKPPLVAIYTAHYTKKPLQNQHLAYSTDRGRTWTKYAGNPVLDIGAKDFRDPKVIWHEGSKKWVMAVAWPDRRKVRFYSSPDLKKWTHLSDFGPAGSVEGIWECPDLFPLTCEGKTRWVLIVSVGSGAPAGGSGVQYFVGYFDGTTFTLDSHHPKKKDGDRVAPALWLDHGPDCYAAVTFSDIPARDGRRILLGWMSNWQYANDVPTSPWRNAMTIPRELSLTRTKAGPRLVSVPVRELKSYHGTRQQFKGGSASEATAWAKQAKLRSGPMDLTVEFAPAVKGNAGVKLFVGENEEIVVSVDRDKGLAVIERTRLGTMKFSPKFPGFATAPLPDRAGKVRCRILIDACSVEVFVDGGAEVLTALTFPSKQGRGVEFFAARGNALSGVVAYPITARRR